MLPQQQCKSIGKITFHRKHLAEQALKIFSLVAVGLFADCSLSWGAWLSASQLRIDELFCSSVLKRHLAPYGITTKRGDCSQTPLDPEPFLWKLSNDWTVSLGVKQETLNQFWDSFLWHLQGQVPGHASKDEKSSGWCRCWLEDSLG